MPSTDDLLPPVILRLASGVPYPGTLGQDGDRPIAVLPGTGVTRPPPGPPGGLLETPFGPLILGGQKGPKMSHFCPPTVQSRGGVGGLRPLT